MSRHNIYSKEQLFYKKKIKEKIKERKESPILFGWSFLFFIIYHHHLITYTSIIIINLKKK